MKDYLDLAIDLAERAGEITMKYFGKTIDVETKSDQSPVTIADRSAEEFIRQEIEKRFPDDGIFGEEYGEKQGKSDYRWVLDPIDGTKSFIRGVAMYGTMIAVEHKGESHVGVVRFPPLKTTISALTGKGCNYNGERCRVSTTASLEESTALTTALNDFTKHFSVAALLGMIDSTKIQRTWGDCYGYMLVATGKADIMIDPAMHHWDVAPMIPIIREAGGTITNIHGECNPGITNTVASNGIVHEAILKILRRP